MIKNGAFQEGLSAWSLEQSAMEDKAPVLLNETSASFPRSALGRKAEVKRWRLNPNLDFGLVGSAQPKKSMLRVSNLDSPALKNPERFNQEQYAFFQQLPIYRGLDVGWRGQIRPEKQAGRGKATLSFTLYQHDQNSDPVARMVYYLAGAPGDDWFSVPNTIQKGAGGSRFFSGAKALPLQEEGWNQVEVPSVMADFDALIGQHAPEHTSSWADLSALTLLVSLQHDLFLPQDRLAIAYRDLVFTPFTLPEQRAWSPAEGDAQARVIAMEELPGLRPHEQNYLRQRGVEHALMIHAPRTTALKQKEVALQADRSYLLRFLLKGSDQPDPDRHMEVVIRDSENREITRKDVARYDPHTWREVGIHFQSGASDKGVTLALEIKGMSVQVADFRLESLPQEVAEVERRLQDEAPDIPRFKLNMAPADRAAMDARVANLLQVPNSPVDKAILSDEDKEYFPGTLEHQGRNYRIKIRYRGMLADHWTARKRSYKVVLEPGEGKIGGARSFNFIIPEDDTGIFYDFAFNQLAPRFSLWSPPNRFVGLFMNGEYQGPYWMSEEFEAPFWERNRIPEGNVYRAQHLDEQRFGQSDLWPGRNPGWFAKKTAYENPAVGVRKQDHADLDQLLTLFREKNPQTFQEKVFTLLDRKNAASWLAFSFLVGDWHMWGGNLRLYFHNSQGRFHFLPWDMILAQTRRHFMSRRNHPDHVWYPPFVERLLTETDLGQEVAGEIARYLEGAAPEQDLAVLLRSMDRVRLVQHLDHQEDPEGFESTYHQALNLHLDNMRFWASQPPEEQITPLSRCAGGKPPPCPLEEAGLHTLTGNSALLEEMETKGRIFAVLEQSLAEDGLVPLRFINGGVQAARLEGFELHYTPDRQRLFGIELIQDLNHNGSVDLEDPRMPVEIHNEPGKIRIQGCLTLPAAEEEPVRKELRMGFLYIPEREQRFFLRVQPGLGSTVEKIRFRAFQGKGINTINGAAITPHVRFVDQKSFRYFDRITQSAERFRELYPMFQPAADPGSR